MQRTNLRLTGLAMLATLTAGCTAPPSTNRADYVGEYIFTPHQNPGRFADFVVLKINGTAVEVRFDDNTFQITTSETTWELIRSAGALAIGDFQHPIERSGATIRLHINTDLNQYYEKVR